MYKRLGDYIREVNVRNRDLKITKPMGINIDKHFRVCKNIITRGYTKNEEIL